MIPKMHVDANGMEKQHIQRVNIHCEVAEKKITRVYYMQETGEIGGNGAIGLVEVRRECHNYQECASRSLLETCPMKLGGT
ncbi:hypothetical protein ACFIQG_22180 [Comamonas odontotermitis]|uniref:hypothetical protein n=1 Tax=Comamonas odontotermitis TaxID=379895 RepID=UPI00366F8723